MFGSIQGAEYDYANSIWKFPAYVKQFTSRSQEIYLSGYLEQAGIKVDTIPPVLFRAHEKQVKKVFEKSEPSSQDALDISAVPEELVSYLLPFQLEGVL